MPPAVAQRENRPYSPGKRGVVKKRQKRRGKGKKGGREGKGGRKRKGKRGRKKERKKGINLTEKKNGLPGNQPLLRPCITL